MAAEKGSAACDYALVETCCSSYGLESRAGAVKTVGAAVYKGRIIRL
jgi:hypothetical protein